MELLAGATDCARGGCAVHVFIGHKQEQEKADVLCSLCGLVHRQIQAGTVIASSE
jgi:hypothetical protein